MHAYMQQAKRRKPWPGRPETKRKKENGTPKPKQGIVGRRGKLPLKAKKQKMTIFLMVLGARGPSSAEIITFFDRNCWGGGAKKPFFFWDLLHNVPNTGRNWTRVKRCPDRSAMNAEIFAKKYFQTRGKIRF